MANGSLAAKDGSALDLALSGGGVRAIAFHAGVLRFLAERGLLECVRHISSVSGGSLFVGLIFQKSEMRWPTSADYVRSILPAIRDQLTTSDLQAAALARLLLPQNWRYIISRANVLARVIERSWGVHAILSDLPDVPVWSINGTTAETGRRFRFKTNGCGDYQLGYADARSFPLAEALAVSAAFPGAIGPLAIRPQRYIWRKRPRWNAPASEAREVQLPFAKLHIYDGGLYDNLGLEPLFDVGKQRAKAESGTIIVSDAGAPLRPGFTTGTLSPLRIKRWFDLASDQQRSLRVRSFINALHNGLPGAYLQIGSCALGRLNEASDSADPQLVWLDAEQVAAAANCPTSLKRMKAETFDLLSRHGYETAFWNERSYPHLPAGTSKHQ